MCETNIIHGNIVRQAIWTDINPHFLASLTAHGLLTTQAIIILQNI